MPQNNCTCWYANCATYLPFLKVQITVAYGNVRERNVRELMVDAEGFHCDKEVAANLNTAAERLLTASTTIEYLKRNHNGQCALRNTLNEATRQSIQNVLSNIGSTVALNVVANDDFTKHVVQLPAVSETLNEIFATTCSGSEYFFLVLNVADDIRNYLESATRHAHTIVSPYIRKKQGDVLPKYDALIAQFECLLGCIDILEQIMKNRD